MIKAGNNTIVLASHFSVMARYWRTIYMEVPNRWNYFHHHAVLKRRRAVLELIRKVAGNQPRIILDAGSGAGVIMADLLKQGHAVRGIENSPRMIDEAREYLFSQGLSDADLHEGSIEESGFEESAFDISLCIGVLQYLDTDQEAIKELSRVTKPGGHIILSIPNLFSLKNLCDPYYYLRRAPSLVWFKMAGCSIQALSYEDIQKNRTFRSRRYYDGQLNKIFRQCNLTVREIRPIGYGPLTFWTKEYLPRSIVLRISNKLEQLACRKRFAWMRIFAERWVLLLEKRRVV